MTRSSRVPAVFCSLILLVASCLCATATAQSTYTIVELGTLPGNPYTAPSSINNLGQITGFSANDGDIGNRGFLYSRGTLTDLGTLDPNLITAFSQGNAINDSGEITGSSSVPDPANPQPAGFTHAFLYKDGTMRDLGTLDGNYSWGYGINAFGQATGAATLAGNTATHAFLYSNGTMHDLGTLPGYDSVGSAINAFGEVTGYLSKTCVEHAFKYNGGTMTDLGTLGGYLSSGNAINIYGEIVGSSTTIASCTTLGPVHAFLYSAGTMRDLGTLGGGSSGASGINATGEIVGWSEYAPDIFLLHAFLYTPRQGMVDLNTLLPSGSGWTLESAVAINDAGQITGNGIAPDGTYGAFLLTPTKRKPTPKPKHS
jgi:probable HAF family extracellular repeat protein